MRLTVVLKKRLRLIIDYTQCLNQLFINGYLLEQHEAEADFLFLSLFEIPRSTLNGAAVTVSARRESVTAAPFKVEGEHENMKLS